MHTVPMQRIAKIGITVLAITAALFSLLWVQSIPPRESALISDFRANRMAYGKLRDLLQTDNSIIRVAPWGVQTADSPIPFLPPKGGVLSQRFTEYLSLLKDAHALGAARSRGENPEVCIQMWGSGWGG